MGQVNIYVK